VGDTGQIKVRVRSGDDLLAVAEALEQEAAARYRSLAARMTRQGDLELAAQFEALAGMEDRHASQVSDRSFALLGHRPDVTKVKWETPPGFDEDEARGAELSLYKALAFAVRNEERAFAFYSYVSAEAQDEGVRAMAEDLARDELQHAAILRQYRRRAFHLKRPSSFPMPATIDELRTMARHWDAEAAQAHTSLAEALELRPWRPSARPKTPRFFGV
jgi:rubrerythrin